MQDYHSLDVWNRAMDYAVSVYKLTAELPQEEKYNLAHQLRKAVTSAPLNMAEGCCSGSNAEFGRFLSYAYRSLKEVVTALELCERLFPSLSRERTQALIDEGSQISRMTYNLMRKIDPRSDSKLITQNS
jgi:four helix bundle protein